MGNPGLQFARNVAVEVGPTEVLWAYRDVSPRFVHYFGGVVPVTKDLSQTYERYENGGRIVATGIFMDELVNDGRFEIAREWDNAEIHGDNIVAGAIFHNSTANK